MFVGSRYDDGVNGVNSGRVQVYAYDESHWNQLGLDIDSESVDDWSRWQALSLSADGATVAIGAYRNFKNGDSSGHVRVYSFVESGWTQMGTDIDGESANDRCGYAVAITSQNSATTVAIVQSDGVRIVTAACPAGKLFTSNGISCTTSCETGELITSDGISCTTSCKKGGEHIPLDDIS